MRQIVILLLQRSHTPDAPKIQPDLLLVQGCIFRRQHGSAMMVANTPDISSGLDPGKYRRWNTSSYTLLVGNRFEDNTNNCTSCRAAPRGLSMAKCL